MRQTVLVTVQIFTIVEEHTDGFKIVFAVVIALGGRLMFDSNRRGQLSAVFTSVRIHLEVRSVLVPASIILFASALVTVRPAVKCGLGWSQQLAGDGHNSAI